jgi:hypothetical protein
VTDTTGPRPDLRAHGARLRVDAQGAEVRAAFARADIPCILLKGRAFAELLYDPDEIRGYADTDLLVPDGQRRRAEGVLHELGFRNRALRAVHVAPEPLHANPWSRAEDRSEIDLHWRLRGSHAPAAAVFDQLADHTVVLEVGGLAARVLDPAASAMLCALHVAQHPLGLTRPGEDLSRAVKRLDMDAWREALRIADRIAARQAFTDGMALTPAAGEIADQLGLPREASLGRRLSTGDGPWGATAIEWLLIHDSLRARARIAFLAVFPTPESMRKFRPRARTGPAGLALAYAARPLQVAAHTPKAIAHWRTTRRAPAPPDRD